MEFYGNLTIHNGMYVCVGVCVVCAYIILVIYFLVKNYLAQLLIEKG